MSDEMSELVRDVCAHGLGSHRGGLELSARDSRGLTLLEAAAVYKGESRYADVAWLLEQGIDVPRQSFGQHGVLNLLMIPVQLDEFDEFLPVAIALVEAGADMGRPSPDSTRTPTMELCNLKFYDDELPALYDAWFKRGDLNLGHQNRAGLTVLEMAKKVPYRADLVARIESYLSDHPEEGA